MNFRCHQEIVQAAGKVIGENTNRIPKEIYARHGEGEGLVLCRAETEELLREAVVDALRREAANGRLEECAVICRTNLDCGLWAQTLREAGIPYALKERPVNPYSHFVIRDICAYLALGQGDMERRNFLRVMNRPVRYMKRESLPQERVDREKLIGYYQNTPIIQEKVKRLYRDIDRLSGMRVRLQIRFIRKSIGYEAYLRDKYGSKKAGELIGRLSAFEEFSGRFVSVQDMFAYMQEYEAVVREPAAEQGGVRLMTIHASKGLEFRKVYLPECSEGKIPSKQAVTQAEIEEERRMLYVAMTRAKRALVLFFLHGKTGKEKPSRFLHPLLSHDSSSTSSSNSAVSKNSSKASATASYSSSSSI